MGLGLPGQMRGRGIIDCADDDRCAEGVAENARQLAVTWDCPPASQPMASSLLPDQRARDGPEFGDQCPQPASTSSVCREGISRADIQRE